MANTKQSARGETKRIPTAEWKAYFDRFSRQYLRDDQTEVATIEILSPTLGDQLDTEAIRLLGTTYDPKEKVLELELEDMDHLVFEPTEIWVIEGEDGFLSTLELVLSDGSKEIVFLRKGSPLADQDEASPSSP